ncbi:hypothetical protein D3C80_1558240 [compost metagenome]
MIRIAVTYTFRITRAQNNSGIQIAGSKLFSQFAFAHLHHLDILQPLYHFDRIRSNSLPVVLINNPHPKHILS